MATAGRLVLLVDLLCSAHGGEQPACVKRTKKAGCGNGELKEVPAGRGSASHAVSKVVVGCVKWWRAHSWTRRCSQSTTASGAHGWSSRWHWWQAASPCCVRKRSDLV